jgi:uncharacterized membrane protein YqaE (UPF0057 family)
MRYLLAVICPPAAVFVSGRRDQLLPSVLLTFAFWLPGVLHALLVVQNGVADQQQNSVADQMQQHRLNSILRR